jgi:hypothetical protein
MYSIIFTAGIFIAIILNDLLQKRSSLIVPHAFLGLIIVGLVSILWYLDFEVVGWSLILLPICALIISYIVVVMTSNGSTTSTTNPSVQGAPPAETGAPASTCIENPGGPYNAVAQPASSTVSLPASSSEESTATMTAEGVPTYKITPLTNDSC